MQLFTRKHPKRKVLGHGGMLSCFGCFAAAPLLPKSTNSLGGKPLDARSIPPVSRWVARQSDLCGRGAGSVRVYTLCELAGAPASCHVI